MCIITGGDDTETNNLWDSLKSERSYRDNHPVYLSISRPGQRSTLWRFSLAVCADHFLFQLIHNDLALQILNEVKEQKWC